MAAGRMKAGVADIQTLLQVGSVVGLSDAQLLERYIGGCGEIAELAFAALVERHGPRVLGVCNDVLADPHEAQDAAQVTFLVLARRAGTIRRRDAIAGWLFGVARRVAARAKVEAARRPLTAMVVILWVAHTGTKICGFTDSRLWWDGLGVFAAAGAGYFLAVSLGLLASAYAPSPRAALLAGPALLFAWDTTSHLVPEIVRMVWPRTSVSTQIRLSHLIGGNAGVYVNILTFHVARSKLINRASWVVPWVAVVMLAGLAAWIAAVFRVSREHGQPVRRSAQIPPEPV